MLGIKAVIFDMDGTILNTLQDIANVVNHALMVKGLPTHELSKFTKFVGNGTDIMLKRALPDELKTDEKVAEIKPDYVEYYDAHQIDTTAPYDGILELLDELKAKGDTSTTYKEVLENVKYRDHLDQTREESPLRKADDAITLDNSTMTRDEQNQWLLDLYNSIVAQQ